MRQKGNTWSLCVSVQRLLNAVQFPHLPLYDFISSRSYCGNRKTIHHRRPWWPMWKKCKCHLCNHIKFVVGISIYSRYCLSIWVWLYSNVLLLGKIVSRDFVATKYLKQSIISVHMMEQEYFFFLNQIQIQFWNRIKIFICSFSTAKWLSNLHLYYRNKNLVRTSALIYGELSFSKVHLNPVQFVAIYRI